MQSADPCTADNAQSVPIEGVLLVKAEAGVLPGLQCRHQCQLGRTVQPAGLDAVDDFRGFHCHQRSDAGGEFGGPILFEEADAGSPGEQAVPRAGRVAAKRGGGAETGDDNGGHGAPW